MSRLRALLLADACNPDWPSLPVVGYKAALAIADHADVVVATHVRNRPAIERSGAGNAEVVYLDNEYVARPLHRLARLLGAGTEVNWTTVQALAYPSQLAFEHEAWKRFRGPLDAGDFDVVHRLTPMSPTLPSPLAKRSPVPFVLGPLNGGLAWPPGYGDELRREREYLTYLRGVYRHLPYHRATYEHAAVILAAFQHTIDDLPPGARERAIDFPEVGIDPALFGSPEPRAAGEPLTFLFAGRLVPYKCADVALAAFAASPRLRKQRLVVVGDGPERARLEATAADQGLSDCIAFEGWQSQAEVGGWMRRADVFVFPSIRELGAGVVVEAMACGAVPVVVDYGGPGGLVEDGSGVRVPLAPKGALAVAFAEALEALVDDEERRQALSRGAHARAIREFAWDVKARKTVEVYRYALGLRETRPHFESEAR